ncbi:hypothetical protein M405DRAFT_822600 [Rhizopogon salebrosus TDB-379]|nr:hypothetical protein M405DRAFT_822600 [Rhizopogon salebrosus TDB-379]
MFFTTVAGPGDTFDSGTSLSNSFLYLCPLNDPFPIHNSLHSDQFVKVESKVDNMQRHENYGDIFKDVRRR